jgi:AcrR family transcriptional regulator
MNVGRARRNAGATQDALIRAARRRFAADGYGRTTVRHIASDVGVDAALINRYFASKAGLFGACIASACNDLEVDAQAHTSNLEGIIDCLVRHTVSPNRDDPLQMLLLLLNDDAEDQDIQSIRQHARERFIHQLAAQAGPQPGDLGTRPSLLRAHLAVAARFGMVTLRSSAAVQPLRSTGEAELIPVITLTLRTLLRSS